MKIKTSELTGTALDWAVAKAEHALGAYKDIGNGTSVAVLEVYKGRVWQYVGGRPDFIVFAPSSNWAQGGPIIERENISVIRCENVSIPDSNGFWCGKYEPQWAAVAGECHSSSPSYGPQGDDWGSHYGVSADAAVGPTALIAAMRCFVASKLGDEVEIPEVLL